jgi:DNA polymerase
MNDSTVEKYWDIINNTIDFLETGYMRNHGDCPIPEGTFSHDYIQPEPVQPAAVVTAEAPGVSAPPIAEAIAEPASLDTSEAESAVAAPAVEPVVINRDSVGSGAQAAVFGAEKQPQIEPQVSEDSAVSSIQSQSQDNQAAVTGGSESVLGEIAEGISGCSICSLASSRKHILAGCGSDSADIFITGFYPGAEADNSGNAIAGNGGDFLKKWLSSIDVSFDQRCYFSYLVKCRPAQGTPDVSQIAACRPYLETQVAVVNPALMIVLGSNCASQLLGHSVEVGGEYEYNGIPLIVFYSPQEVLQRPELKRPVWETLKKIRTML